MIHAERQEAYKARQNEISERVDITLNCDTERRLERLAKHYGLTKRFMLATVLAEAENRTFERERSEGIQELEIQGERSEYGA